MSLIKNAVLICALAGATVAASGQQQKQEPPTIEFGTSRVSLGMTVQQVEESLAGNERQMQFLPDKVTALVYRNGASDDTEGQVTFAGGRAVYAAFQFPVTRDANELAQEIAGAVDSMETKVCETSNFSSHGTGGGHSDVVFDCGSKRFTVMTVEILGSSERHTHVEITIGSTTTK
jgi:hypothetical protein